MVPLEGHQSRAYGHTPLLNLPAPGTMVSLSPIFNPPIIKGITIYPENPLLHLIVNCVHDGVDFILGDRRLDLLQSLVETLAELLEIR